MERRTALKGLTALSAVATTLPTNRTFGMGNTSLLEDVPYTATGIAEAIASEKATAADISEEVISRVVSGQGLEAFISFEPDILRDAALAADQAVQRGDPLGPLHGVPVALKDNIEAVGYANTGGTPALKAYHPQNNATVTQRLIDAGAIIAGKLNMDELAGGGTTNNPTFGRTRNPYKTEHIPGGSSGGAAAAVGGRLVPAALGTDTAGSIRTPAAYCGVAGLRPTQKRVPNNGILPLALSRDTCGPIATTVADVALIDGVIAADHTPLTVLSLKGVRLGLPTTTFQENLSPAVGARLDEVIECLEEEGVVFVREDVPDLATLVEETSLITLGGAFRGDMEAYLRERNTGVSFEALADQIANSFVRGWIEPYLSPTADIIKSYETTKTTAMPKLKQAFESYLKKHRLDAILFPTSPVTAGIELNIDGDMIIDGETIPNGVWLNIQNTGPASLWGGPGLSIPAGLSESGLPIGIEIDGAINADRHLLALGLSIESVMPLTPAPA